MSTSENIIIIISKMFPLLITFFKKASHNGEMIDQLGLLISSQFELFKTN